MIFLQAERGPQHVGDLRQRYAHFGMQLDDQRDHAGGPGRPPSATRSHVASAGWHRYLRGMSSSCQRRGRSRQQLQTHQVAGLTKRANEEDSRAEERNRRWFMLNVITSAITSAIITLVGGWLFWRLPPPQPEGQDVRISGGTRHGIRGGGTLRITLPQDVGIRVGGRHQARGGGTPTVKG